MSWHQKLELTWIGKDERPRLEPRILLEDSALSYHAKERQHEDIFENRLIHGDNLLALKALEQEFSGKVKCIYIDPPYNTGSAFEHYDDGLEHSLWLTLMRNRIELLRSLLAHDGLLFVQIDDNEMAYLTVLLDEIFGRNNRVNVVAVKMSEASGVKMSHVDKKLPKLKEYILIYRKDITPKLKMEGIHVGEWNDEYKTILLGIEKTEIDLLKEIIDHDICTSDDVEQCNGILKNAYTETLASHFKRVGVPPTKQSEFKFANAWRIIQAVGSSSVLAMAKQQPVRNQEIAAGLSARGLIYLYKTEFDFDAKQPRIQVIFADQNLLRNPGDFWTDIKTTGGVGQEGGVLFPNGKKPEALIRRIIQMCTNHGDLVLDSFAGSGTTGAVAHKMGRRWIMIELGDHASSHCVPRLKKVIDGEDPSGITEVAGWRGGGGYRFYRLAPSLLAKDRFDNWVIAPSYNAAMLAEAVCKLMGFTYAPSQVPEEYWRHGHSTETDFIYVTTQSLTHDALKKLSDEVGPKRTLLVCCKAWNGKESTVPNLTVKKIPQAVLKKCEWGRDDYSLTVASLPVAPNVNGADVDTDAADSGVEEV
ncbi:adenine-specific DNA-methyltransferase [Acidiphilium sp. MT5]